jgi:hypothetical protein
MLRGGLAILVNAEVASERAELSAHEPRYMMISSSTPPLQHQHWRMGRTAASNKDESEDTCVICLSVVTERAITSPCNHYTFDFVCLVSWLQERSTCPLCKQASMRITLTVLLTQRR